MDRPVTAREAPGRASREGELLERARELEALGALLARVAAGGGGVLVVEGPAGIGKSRLLDAARGQAAAAGMLALRARASELESGYSFGVVRQLFEPALAGIDDTEALFAGAAGLARPIVDAGASSTLDPGGDGFAVLHGLYWLTANLAGRGALVLSVDDVQWCDPASLQFLAYLVPRLEDLALGLIVGARTGERGTHGAAFAAVAADPSAVRVRPAALSETAVRELLERAFGSEPEDVFSEACHRSTAGNPLLVHELVGALRAMDVRPTAAYVEAVPRVGAGAVHGFVLRRLDRLTGEERALARAVAVLGDRAELELAAAVAGLERAAAVDAAERLVRADLLAAGTPLGFVHPLVRLAVYETIEMSERELAHARAAALLAQAGASAERVALQLMHAPPGSADDAVGTLREAARQAIGEGVPSAAAEFLGRALSEPLEAHARGAVLCELGEAALHTDPRSAAEYLGEAVELLDDPERLARARLRLGRALYETGRSRDAIDVLELALADAALPPAMQDRLEYELVNSLEDDLQTERAVERAVALHRRHTSGEQACGPLGLTVLSWLACVLPLSRREAAAYASAALADDVLLHEESDAFFSAAHCLMGADEYALARAALDRARARAVASGSVGLFAWATQLGARIFYFLGQLHEAEAEARVGLDAAESHGVEAQRPWLASRLGDVLLERGRLEEAAALIRSARSPDPAQELLALLVSDMQLCVDEGRPEDALPALAELQRRFAQHPGNPVPAPLPWRSTAARALAALGRGEEALALARTEVDLARGWGAPRPLGRALRILGTLEAGAAGLAALREAVAVLEDSPARLERAHALAALGGAVRRAGQRAEAREPLRRALELAQLCGAHALESHVREELLVAGARPRRTRLQGVDALTAAELRVAQLAAAGTPNKEIAQALFVALKTVEGHLASVYRKLDIRSRTQLAEALASRTASG
jgi:DNA-binding CsgD family transcriptional regulator